MRVDSKIHLPQNLNDIKRIEGQIFNHFFKEKTAKQEIQSLLPNFTRSSSVNIESVQKKLDAWTNKLDALQKNRVEIQHLISRASILTSFEKSYLNNIFELEIVKVNRQIQEEFMESHKIGRIASQNEAKSRLARLTSNKNGPILNKRESNAGENVLKTSGISHKSSSFHSEKSGRSGLFQGTHTLGPYKHNRHKDQYLQNAIGSKKNYVLRRRFNVDLRTSPYVKKFEQITHPKEGAYQRIERKRVTNIWWRWVFELK